MQNPLPPKELASALEEISEENEHKTLHEEPENVEPEEKVVVEEKRIMENPVSLSKEDNRTAVEVKTVETKQDLSGDCCCVY